MNKTKLLKAIQTLFDAVNSGREEKMCRCAFALDSLFKTEVPDPFKDYESAWIRFKMAEAVIAFYRAGG